MNEVSYMIYGSSPPGQPIIIRKKGEDVEAWSSLRPFWESEPEFGGAFWGCDCDCYPITENEVKKIIDKYTKG